MKKIFFYFLFICFCKTNFYGQLNLNIENVYSYSTENSNFSNEWQYLSTDVFLLNPNMFEKLLTELTDGESKSKKKLQYLYLSISVNNENFLGENKFVEYPIYNFKIKKKNKGKYKYSIETNDAESLRIIDKYPLLKTEENLIEAKINGFVILENQENIINNLIANNLLNISSISPNKMILSLVGEYGKLLQNSVKGISYKFTYGINLYKENNKNIKLHSLKIYVFKPSSETNSFFIKSKKNKLNNFFKKNTLFLEKNFLSKKISYRKYPYLVIANYRSIYKSETMSNYNDIDEESLKEDELKIRNLKKKKQIDKEIYNQEMEYLSFLKKINEIKTEIESFKKAKTKGKEKKISSKLKIILMNYKNIKNKIEFYENNFKNKTTYLNIFQTKYIDMFNFLSANFENEKELKNVKNIINIIDFLNKNFEKISKKQKERNNYLKILHNLDLKFFIKSLEEKSIKKYIEKLEEIEFNMNFKNDLKKLNSAKIDSLNLYLIDSLNKNIQKTFCKKCKTNVKKITGNFEKNLFNKNLEEFSNNFFEISILSERVEKNLKIDSIQKKLGIAKNIISRKHKNLRKKIISIDEKLNQNFDSKSKEELQILQKNIFVSLYEIKNSYDKICKNYEFLLF